MLCCNDGISICLVYDGITIGSIATYATSESYCIMGETKAFRKCTNNHSWDGDIPTISKGNIIAILKVGVA